MSTAGASTSVTDDGLLRHVVYRGLREDKLASEVRRERPPVNYARN
jgi:ATP-dependent DNA ligase